MSGFFLVHRGWMDAFKPEPFTEREAFLWSVEHAAYGPHEMWFKSQRIAVERGQFATSIRSMAEAFDWSIKRVRGFMERMGKAGMWAHHTAHSGAQSPTIITVCNYDKYQTADAAEGTVKGTPKGTSGAQRGHSRGTQQKEGNKGKKEDSPSDSSIGEPMSLPAPASASVPMIPPADDVGTAFAAYDELRRELVPGARAVNLTPDRRHKLALRLSEIGGLEVWREVLACIRGSPFLQGDNRSGRLIATIDWLLEPKNLRKITEGNYDERSDQQRSRQSPRASPIDAMRAARAAIGLGGPQLRL